MKNKKREKGGLEKGREKEGRTKYNMREQIGKECFHLRYKAHSFFTQAWLPEYLLTVLSKLAALFSEA